MEVDLGRPDGSRISLDIFSAPIFDESGVMRSAMSLFVDTSERRRAESEQVRIQQELIAFQAAALAERSTPLIPISDEIMVLPLIGSLDTERGNQILDSLLSGVSQTGTRVAIIDVTGVRNIDTQAAQTLTQAAQALRLLGVEPVLTGIRAEVAQTLVSLGVPLDGLATRSTLQSGIAYANRKKSR
jgi:rsbT co-antagonist protein RsbR